MPSDQNINNTRHEKNEAARLLTPDYAINEYSPFEMQESDGAEIE